LQDFAPRRFLNVGGSLSKGACRASADSHIGSFARKFIRDGAAKPFAGGRNDSYAASEP
jgi:hypothetical protein